MPLTPSALALFWFTAASFRVLVLPFEDLSGVGDLNWKGSLIEESISAQLEAAGHDVVDVERRNDALSELGFAPGEPVSRASAILIARELAAERLVMGAYETRDGDVHATARLLDLERAVTLGVIRDHAREGRLVSLSNQIAKNLFRIESNQAPASFESCTVRRSAIPLGALQASARARLAVDFEDQRAQLERALGMAPHYVEAKHFLGRLLVGEGRARDGIDLLVDASTDGAFHYGAYFDLGRAYLAVGEDAAAEEVFGALARANPRASYHNNHGVALVRLERVDEAIEAFRRARSLRPEDPMHTFNLGWAYWLGGKGRTALELFEDATRLNPLDGEAYFLLSAAAASQASSERAAAHRRVALRLAPQLAGADPATVSGWARPTHDESRTIETAPTLREHPEDVASLTSLLEARELRRQGRRQEAMKTLQRGLYDQPSALELRRELAMLLREQGKLEQAARELSILAWSEPAVETHVALARIYLELGDPSKASEHLDRALALEPEHEEARELRALLAAAP